MITRGYTSSEFDHVAMILKFESENDDLFILDSTSTHGVAITRWSGTRVYVGDFYERIVFRHLNLDRTNEMIDVLDTFLHEAVGKKYGLSADKLFTKKKTMKAKDGKLIDDDRSFFCSELIAKAYKVLGLIGEDEISSQYFPANFSGKGDI